jgi:hypothetical protein
MPLSKENLAALPSKGGCRRFCQQGLIKSDGFLGLQHSTPVTAQVIT